VAELADRALRPGPQQPRAPRARGETARLIKRGLLADLVGLTLAVHVATESLAGSLFVQASMQAGFAFGGGDDHAGRPRNHCPITSLEMLSVLGNTQVIFCPP
jgi:hypothetical protein